MVVVTEGKLAKIAFRDVIRREKAVINEAVAAVQTSNLEWLQDALERIDGRVYRGWERFFKHVKAQCAVSDAMRTAWLRIWVHDGDHIRQETGDDLLLASALRLLLPPYQGPALTLYRGDSFYNRRCRTYGMSWTADRNVAQGFAEGMWRTFEGGSVLLETHAPASAIICAVHLQDNDRYGEAEYLVDRRALGAVTVVERFAQQTPEENQAGVVN